MDFCIIDANFGCRVSILSLPFQQRQQKIKLLLVCQDLSQARCRLRLETRHSDQSTRLWVPEVNAQGGIFVKEYNKKLPIELKIYDDKSDQGTMTRLTEKLILEDKVDFLFPACGTACLFAASPYSQ